MNGLDVTQLGVAGVVVAILLAFLKVLWEDNKALRRQAREDQERVLPALAEASNAMAEFARVAELLRDDARSRG